ncbi:MAG: AAA family ATPase [Chloroflexi bacterium]|nr:AAA family ATPase [Chloroflexota bacterium]
MDSKAENVHPTGDEVLSILANVPGALGGFASAYPGSRSEDDSWIDSWFVERATKYCGHTIGPDDKIVVHKEFPDIVEGTLGESVRLKSIEPHYFRGFRDIPEPINVDANLVVFEGRNSSGKTSLAEALEWLFTGRLSRRECHDLGSARELENCITNEFRPDGDQTWVEAIFLSSSKEKTKQSCLRRVLKSDYGATIESKCDSVLLKNGTELSKEEESKELDQLFASEPPLLMQHTLRDFVQSNPRERRGYFERLLKLDELTSLIGKAVIGPARIKEFDSPSGSKALKELSALEGTLEADSSKKACAQLYQKKEGDLGTRAKEVLARVARLEVAEVTKEIQDFDGIRVVFQQEQEKAKQKTFPLLAKLRPRRVLEAQAGIDHSLQVNSVFKEIREAWVIYGPAKAAAVAVGKEHMVISNILSQLGENGLVQTGAKDQICPVCEYKDINTLTVARVKEILGWAPIQEAEKSARRSLQEKFDKLAELAAQITKDWDESLPRVPSDKEWQDALQGAGEDLKSAVADLRKLRNQESATFGANLTYVRGIARTPQPLPDDATKCEEYMTEYDKAIKELDKVSPTFHKYREAVIKVEAAASAVARVDPKYRVRETWLVCSENCSGLADDLNWEYSKKSAQSDLETMREALIAYRKHFLEARRVSFNDGIGMVWTALRSDQYSSFSQLHIPEPRGKGFPVEIEVKAQLDDGDNKKEVDALRVFSESQVNALGIAAFVTRSKLLGHRMLIFDDPVQSMDEEHFKTFAKDVLNHVLSEGFQVIVLTHNDTFAKDVSYYHRDRPESEYVTLRVVLNKRKGCSVEEGNRRISERLRRAEKEAEEGHLEPSWILVRLALERLYLLAQIKFGPDTFDPRSWQDQTAEYMWSSGVDNIIESRIPGSSKELRDILVRTASGGHDKAARGETDLRNAVKYIRNVVGQLGLGG